MKKGFTLIELLAVIIVLAIIALIATPIVLDVIKDSKDSAARSSAHGVLHSANYYYAEEYIKNNGSFTEYECSFSNGEGCDLLSISGDKPTTGSLSINKDGMINGKIEFNEYVFYICNSKVLESESSECSFIEYDKIYAINESGVITGFKTEDVASILDFIIPTVNASSLTSEATEYIKTGKITIPEYVGNVEVTGIADNAFSSYEITEVTILSSKVITIGTNAFPTTLTKLRVNSCLIDKYNLNIEIEGIGTCETTTPTPTYQAYSVGDEVTLIDGTTWVVVNDTTSEENEIKIMSSTNVRKNLTTQTGTAMFTSVQNEYYIPYSSGNNSNVWANSTLKTYLEGTVKQKLESSLNIEISNITIWGAEELSALGCTVTGNETSRYSSIKCDSTKPWYSKVFKKNYSWTRLGSSSERDRAWVVYDDGRFITIYVTSTTSGVRPIITVSKSVISQQSEV